MMNRQLTPESAMKTTMRSGFLPRIPLKSSMKMEQGNVFQSLDADKMQRRTKNFDFSNLGRAIQTGKPGSRNKTRQGLQPLNYAMSQKIQTRAQLNRIIVSITKALHSDLELQVACKHLYASSQKVLQLLLMITSPASESEGFYTIHRKLKQQLTMKSDMHETEIPVSDRENQSTLNIVEIDRMIYCLQYLSIPVPLNYLILLAQLSSCLFIDTDFGMVVQFSSFMVIIGQAIQSMKQQEQSTTGASDQEDDNNNKNQLSTPAKIVQRLLNRQGEKKVQFKIKRLGYLNEMHVVAFYDSFADLKKRVGRDWNAKNYIFSCIRLGYIDLVKYPQYHDECSKMEHKVFGNSRSHLPMYIQFIYKHKSSNQELPLTKIHFHQPNQTMDLHQEGRELIQSPQYLNAYSLCNKFQSQYIHEPILTNELDTSKLNTLCLKDLFTDVPEQPGQYYSFDAQQQYNIKRKEYKPDEILLAESSDSDYDDCIYQPLFVKSIQSYPLYLNATQTQLTYPTGYRFYYNKMFTTCKSMKDEYNDYKIKSAYQFTENFVVVPSCDRCPYQRNMHRQPDTLEHTDESDNELQEQPLEALDKQDLSLSFQFQPTFKEHPDENVTEYLKSVSSVVVQEEYKVNDKIHFAHNLSDPFICLQDNHAMMYHLRYPLNIPYQLIQMDVTKDIPLKEVTVEANTVIIDNTLTFESIVKDLDTAPINDAESEEEPSFDEPPLEVDLPETQEQQSVEVKQEEDDEINIEKVTQTMDLELKNSLTVEVKGEYVSRLLVDNIPVYFFLGERHRKQEPIKYNISMEGKQIKSMQVSVEQQRNRILLKSFSMLAQVDQRYEVQVEKKATPEEQDDQLNIYDTMSLPDDWNSGEFIIHINFNDREEVTDNLLWLKNTLRQYFKQIKIIDGQSDGFETYIYGVGHVNKRDGSNRVLLFRKEAEEWDQFNQHFQYRSLQLFDTLNCVISIYGSVAAMGMAQSRFYKTQGNSPVQKNQLYPYKYIENIDSHIRPATGQHNRTKRP